MNDSFASVVASYWWVVAVALVVSVASTAWIAWNQPPTYRANTTLVLAPIDGLGPTRDIVDSLNTLDRRSVVATLATVPSSRTIENRAMAELKLTPAQLEPYVVKTAVVPDTNVIEVTVEGPDPRLAAAFAYAIAQQSILSTPAYYDIYALKILDVPVIPTEDVGPGLVRKLLVGAILGLLIGIGAAMLLAYLALGRIGLRLGQSVNRLLPAVGRKPNEGERSFPSAIKAVHLADAPDQQEVTEEGAAD